MPKGRELGRKNARPRIEVRVEQAYLDRLTRLAYIVGHPNVGSYVLEAVTEKMDRDEGLQPKKGQKP